jgi:imidazolonepropionase-like amidohydrolase
MVIDGGGRVLMPGLIDAHAHLWFETLPWQVGPAADWSYIDIVSGIAAQALLMRGFTAVRDAGGPVFGLKRAIDEGLVAGPRIFPSSAFISQTSGHGDFRSRYEVPRGICGHLSHQELVGAVAIADGVGEVLRAVREQLMLGASQIKMMAGGAFISPYDPIDVTEYTEAELRAGVEAAENWGTYVLIHAYTPRAVQQGIRTGVRCIEHGHLLDEGTVVIMAEHEVWWSQQPFLDDEDAFLSPTRPDGPNSSKSATAPTPRTSWPRNTRSSSPGALTLRLTPSLPAGGGPAGQDDSLVHPRRSPPNGDLSQC